MIAGSNTGVVSILLFSQTEAKCDNVHGIIFHSESAKINFKKSKFHRPKTLCCVETRNGEKDKYVLCKHLLVMSIVKGLTMCPARPYPVRPDSF